MVLILRVLWGLIVMSLLYLLMMLLLIVLLLVRLLMDVVLICFCFPFYNIVAGIGAVVGGVVVYVGDVRVVVFIDVVVYYR